MNELTKLIAFYLPQFHPIPENDQWWGKGFTEWTNVRKAVPRFPGHYQPHIPGLLGYYDLRSIETRQAQAELAKAHGIHGFCYYHYWFNGHRLLETPFNEVLKKGKPDFPFCICWANENWTRRWDGAEQEILMAQDYSDEDSLNFINDLIPAFRDDRYIRINGKPLLLIYRTSLLPNPKHTAEIWREAAHRAGLDDLYLVRIESRMDGIELAPEEIGFDAAVEFAPNWTKMGPRVQNLAEIDGEEHQLEPDVNVYDYEQIITEMLLRQKPSYKLYRGIFPAWDNSARRANGPVVIANSSPEKYAFWLTQLLRWTQDNFRGEERMIFVNAWNEWAEGCHLEPDQEHGLSYLQATQAALTTMQLLSCPERGFDKDLSPQLLRSFGSSSDLLLKTYVRLNSLKNENSQLKNELLALNQKIDTILNSQSWKITAPLRQLSEWISGTGKAGKS